MLRFTRIAASVFGFVCMTSLVGCAGETDEEDAEGSDAALTAATTLRAQDCRTISTPNQSRTAGVFDAPLTGCFVARNGETGAQMLSRAIKLVTTPDTIGAATHPDGSKLFASFKPTAPQSGPGHVWYDAKASFDIDGPLDAKGTLHFDAVHRADGSLTVTVTNTSSIGALFVNPIKANGLAFVLKLTPAANGVVVSGSVKVTLDSYKNQVGNVSSLAPEIVGWMKKQLGAQ